MSSTLTPLVLGKKAIAWIQGDIVTPFYNRQRGFSGPIVRNGAGDYLLTLADPISFSDVLITPGVVNTNLFGSVTFELVSSTVIRSRAARFSAGPGIAPADFSFWIVIEEFGPE